MMTKAKDKQYRIKSSEIVWDENKDARLTFLYSQQTQLKHLARVFNCSETTIQRRLKVLNLLPDKWTTQQDSYLAEYFTTKTNQELSNELNINVVYIADRIAFLGLVRKQGRPKGKKKRNKVK